MENSSSTELTTSSSSTPPSEHRIPIPKGWITYQLEGYAPQYSQLIDHWNIICKKIGIAPREILVVNKMHDDNDELNKHLNQVCELLTYNGYVVRRTTELVPCSICGKKAVVTQEAHDLINSSGGGTTPPPWIDHCSTCSD